MGYLDPRYAETGGWEGGNAAMLAPLYGTMKLEFHYTCVEGHLDVSDHDH